MGDGNQAAEVRRTFSADGVHLLRTTQQIQYQLSQMADQKASMLLGVTFVIFTISVGQVTAGHPQPALLVLAAAAFAAAVLTVSAVLPSVKTPPRPDGPANILFFGAFTQLPEDEYVERLLEIATDTQTVYEAFAHDIYQNGRVLGRKKYRLLGYAYAVLLTGLIASFVTFVATVLWKMFVS
ncbi:Pycsar system effector family protein [Phenylobacterium sp.]|uniref:Pycsar system effector family protein n=1 Tax=Phenylobacterium sp. TaxID=1871053 RepID=UPI0025CD2563|nr:Pycsar system effector family protein [Phenylobacterium sp.]